MQFLTHLKPNGTAVVTQLYYQVYITYQHQLHVSANAAVVIICLDTIYQRSYIDMT